MGTELPEVINLEQEVQKAREDSKVVHFHGFSLNSEIVHFLFCNNRIFGDGCIGHFPRTCKEYRPKTTSLEKTDQL